MRGVILAADNGLNDSGELPKCLMELQDETVVEQQIEQLNECGVEEVTVVIGDNEAWSDAHREYINGLDIDVCENPVPESTGNAYSFFLSISDRQITSDTIVLNGDVVFETARLRSMIENEGSTLLARPAASVSEPGGRIKTHQGKVSDAGKSVEDKDFPWFIYGGVAKLAKDTVEAVADVAEQQREAYLLDLFGNLAPKVGLMVVDTTVPDESDIKSTIGGSYADIEIKRYIRKETEGRGSTKLREEIEWLRDLPSGVKEHFPEVHEYEISEDKVWMEQPYYEWPSLRDLLFDGGLTANEAVNGLENIIRFSFESLYNRTGVEAPEDFLQVYHFDRVWYRLYRTQEDAPLFEDLISADTIHFNGEDYLNLPAIIHYLEQNRELRKLLMPDSLSKYGHFDLHFQNILIDPNTYDFVLVDPRGYEACDPYYDLGKLYHSTNGMYDFIDRRDFSVNWKIDDSDITATLKYDHPAIERYRTIKESLPGLFSKHVDGTTHEIMLKVQFNELMHFSSLIPFHLDYDNTEAKGVAFYLTAVRLANEFVREYSDDFKHDEWIDVNTKEQYERVKDWRLKGE